MAYHLRWFALAFSFAAHSGELARAELVGQELIVANIDRPVFIAHAPGDAERLFILRQQGVVRVMNLTTGVLETTPFLTIPDTLMSGESGLVGMAFHPEYQSNGKFYVYVTVSNGGEIIDGIESPLSAVVREYTVSADPNVANTTYTPILEVVRPTNTHVAGWMGFSPIDKFLYVASGDGGHSYDRGPGHTVDTGNAQDITDNLMGKILRLDVNGDDFSDDAERNYAIPESNPFAGVEGDDEIWAYGLRNPYRASFDRLTGDLWIGDVGQGRREEVDLIPADSPGGVNFGWRLREGTIQTPQVGGAKPPGAVDPVYEYAHDSTNTGGQSIAGGYVYRGPDPDLQGKYFFADSQTNKLWMLDPADIPQSPDDAPLTATQINSLMPPDAGEPFYPVSFGEDLEGNLYLAYYFSDSIYRVRTGVVTPGDFNGDNTVDAEDLAAWQNGFGATAAALRTSGDADRDGDVDGSDFLVWQGNLSTPALPAIAQTPIPEPNTLIAAPLIAVAAARRAKNGRLVA